jgi:ferredoxin
MIRKIITIDRDRCNGCGLCVKACQEGAIGLKDGKAVLLRDDYCDGLGNCLPACPAGAIGFEEREAAAYDEQAVKARLAEEAPHGGGCPGAKAMALAGRESPRAASPAQAQSMLNQWPVQIKLVPVSAPFFEGAKLLVAADCAAYAYAAFHEDFMRDKITLIGCPKLDEGDYSEKLAAILGANNIRSLTVVRMEVPCCGGIERAAITALQNSGKMIPWQVVTISREGQVLAD